MRNSRLSRYLLVGVVALVAGLCLRSCFHKTPTNNIPVVTPQLPDGDIVRIAVKGPTLEVQTPKSTEYKYVPDEGQAVVDVQKDGTPHINVTSKGFTSKMAIDVLFADKLRVGGSCEFAYWNRFGVLGGIGVAINPLVIGYLGASYQLDQIHLNNTSLFVGYTTARTVAVGASIRL